MQSFRTESDEVFYIDQAPVSLGKDEIEFLKTKAANNPRQRARICLHDSPDSPLHEMVIAHGKSIYVHPHRHMEKEESIQVLEGSTIVIFFSEHGEVTEVREISAASPGQPFYIKIPRGVYHTFLIKSDWLIFMETALGPFDRTKTAQAAWAPNENDAQVGAYLNDLAAQAERHRINARQTR